MCGVVGFFNENTAVTALVVWDYVALTRLSSAYNGAIRTWQNLHSGQAITHALCAANIQTNDIALHNII